MSDQSVASTDLRVLTLIHALGNADEFYVEAIRLLMLPATDEKCWRMISDLGRELDPSNPLFDPARSLAELRRVHADSASSSGDQAFLDRRRKDRRVAQRRRNPDRRSRERRNRSLAWLGPDRRGEDRRHGLRRRADRFHAAT